MHISKGAPGGVYGAISNTMNMEHCTNVLPAMNPKPGHRRENIFCIG